MCDSQSTSLTKTKTYDVIAGHQDLVGAGDQSVDLDAVASQVSSTKSTVNTELLLGDTEQLMESIKKRRTDKKLALRQRLANANKAIQDSKIAVSPSSSSCSSSTVSIENRDG